jgi:hypothetical protein
MHDLVRPQRPELEAEMSVFNLAQKRSFPPLCSGGQLPTVISKYISFLVFGHVVMLGMHAELSYQYHNDVTQ